jgi:hypothetical protein
LPPEVFVGRKTEKNEIESPGGSCLVYGGRQLGKTALLREIARQQVSGGTGRVVIWLDLNGLGLEPGQGRSLDEVWVPIGQKLQRAGVQGAAFGDASRVRGAVERWLRDRPGRRILVLLDEADAFIEADGRSGFSVIRQIKGLMDATQYAFKAVLTGLHNVQRVSQDNNAPIPHLGEAVSIGPLHGRDEAREASRLVTEPFAARGFGFDPPDLPTTILARANYYPSLIQLICSRLIDSLDRSGTVPPHAVNEAQLRQVLGDPDLQRQLRERFELTIGLDPRYQLFALCLALHSIDEPGDLRLVDGLEEGWFVHQALDLWPDGFPDRPLGKVVSTLLHEMSELGVFAKTNHPDGSTRYVLRRSGLRSLLGNRRQISDQLAGFIGRPPPTPYAPGSFRRRLAEGEADPRRSPFSAEDERALFAPEHGVVIVLGSLLAGIDEAMSAIRLACPPERARVEVERSSGGGSVEEWVLSLLRAAEQEQFEGVTLLLVEWGSGWQADLPFLAANASLGRVLHRSRLIRIAFLAGPAVAWRWREATRAAHAVSSAARIREITLRPWEQETLRRWAEETGVPGGRDEIGRDRIRDLTGGFGPMLAAYAENPPQEGERPEDTAARLLASFGPVRRRGRATSWTRLYEDVLIDWPKEPRQALSAIAGVMVDPMEEVFTADDLQSAADIPRDLAARIIEWGESLGFLAEVLAGRYRLNPLLARVLPTAGA